MAVPIFDLISTAWPPQPGALQWRYGFLGLLANVLLTPLLGLVLASLVAIWLRQTRTLQVLAILCLVAALVCAVAIVLFALDVLQLGNQVAQASVTNYRAGAAIAGGKYVLAMAALVWLGIGGLRTVRALRDGVRTR